MKRIQRLILPVWVASASACINQDLNYYEVTLTGTITTADPQFDDRGQLTLELHHESIGEGMFERPLGLIDSWTLATGERQFTGTTLVSQDNGAEGLVIYGWLDLDGDGTLCSPDGNRDEPAGLVVIDGYPAHELEFALVLDEPCLGPEGLLR